MWGRRKTTPQPPKVDVCLIVEGCYPYVAGGVSTWVDWLIKGNPHLTFAVVAIVADSTTRERRYRLPENVIQFNDLPLHRTFPSTTWQESAASDKVQTALAEQLVSLVNGGGLAAFRNIVGLVRKESHGLTLSNLLASPLSWRLTCETYNRLMPQASFLHFFWAWRALFGGLFAVLAYQLPRASVYHTISTGYAGLLAARAAIETGSPTVITEHGIYTNERRVEILMAEWIYDTVDKGISLQDTRIDLRDIWMRTFDAHALVCYEACARIVTLYEDNQRLQLALGARPERLSIIPNGIDIARFENVASLNARGEPTVALIGRVVPIKDVKSYIEAVALIRKKIPRLRALILGPTDEDPAYYQECLDQVREEDLDDTVVFTGAVNIFDYLPRIHVVALTSLSEAQPLVLLEAGAAGIPCVATDVGSCREILEGRSNETPRLGNGGEVTALVNPEQTADAVIRLLMDEEGRRNQGEILRSRVRKYYASQDALRSYRELYDELISRSAMATAQAGK